MRVLGKMGRRLSFSEIEKRNVIGGCVSNNLGFSEGEGSIEWDGDFSVMTPDSFFFFN